MTKQTDELADLKRRVAELEAAQAPAPAPFVPQPHQTFDPTARMSMPRSTLREMAAAVPDGMIAGIVHDNRAPTGRPGVIPPSPQRARSGGARVPPGSGTGWAREVPLGPSMHQRYVDAQLDAQDAKDRAELAERLAKR